MMPRPLSHRGFPFDLAAIWLVAAIVMVLLATYGDWSRVLWP